jgi:hypothetical protein
MDTVIRKRTVSFNLGRKKRRKPGEVFDLKKYYTAEYLHHSRM